MLTKAYVLVQQGNISSVHQKGVPSAIVYPLRITVFNFHSDVVSMM